MQALVVHHVRHVHTHPAMIGTIQNADHWDASVSYKWIALLNIAAERLATETKKGAWTPALSAER